MTGNARLENVPPSRDFIRISNHVLKEWFKKIPGNIEANYFKEVR